MTALLDIREINGDALQKLRDASPINHLRSNMPTYLLIQGDRDTTVVPGQAYRFQSGMLALGN